MIGFGMDGNVMGGPGAFGDAIGTDDERSIFAYGIPKPSPLLGLLTDEEAMDIMMAPRPNAVPPNISYSNMLGGYITNNGLISNAMGAVKGIRNMFGPTYGPNAPPVNVPGYDPNPGMGMGGGPDAAQMSLDDFGINNALSQEESDVYNLDNALAQLDLEPFYNYINPAIEAIKNSAIAEAAKKIDAVPVPGLEVIQGLDIGKKVLDAIPDIMDVNFPSYGPSIPGKGGGVFSEPDVFEPSMNLQMELNPAIDSNLPGVEGLMEAGGLQGGGSGVIGPDFDMGAVSQKGGGELQEALAQRAAETIIAQQAARQVTPQSNKVTIPTSSGPNIVIDVTPPAPQTRVAPHRRAAPKPSPVQIAAKSITKPKAFKALPKFAQKELRQGKVPTGGSDNVQDMVRDFLGGQKAFGDSGTRK